jgi:hypothetical protein
MEKITSLGISSGKIAFIVGIGVAIVGGGLFLANSSESEDAESVPAVSEAAVSPTKQGDDSAYENTMWNTAVGGVGAMPENWPKDAPVAIRGATLMSSLAKDLGTQEPNPSVIYFTPTPLDEAIAYYVRGLTENGWKIDTNADSAGYRVITASKDTRSFFAFVSSDGAGKTGVTSGVTFKKQG